MVIKGFDLKRKKSVEVEIDSSYIVAIREIDETGLPYISTGFTDLQVNGYKGADYSSDNLDYNSIRSIAESLAVSGTVRHLATIITGDFEKTKRNIETIVSAVKMDRFLNSAIAGIHLEGPYISSVDGARGAHDPDFVRSPDIGELLELYKASEGLLKVITVAPELEGCSELIKLASKLGVKVSLGHSNAKTCDINQAIENGLTLSTHLGNGLSQEINRRENPIWGQLADDRITCGIISDGFHLTREQMIVFSRAKTLDRIFLVSDVGPMAGMNPGVYKWGDIDVEVYKDGHLGLHGTPYLAGAGHLLDWSIARFVNMTGYSLRDALRLVTDIPSCILDNKYSLDIGQPADIVQFNFNDGDNRLKINQIIVNGETICSI